MYFTVASVYYLLFCEDGLIITCPTSHSDNSVVDDGCAAVVSVDRELNCHCAVILSLLRFRYFGFPLSLVSNNIVDFCQHPTNLIY
jgi:hypothetical protein